MDRYEGFREFVGSRSSALSRTAYLLTGDFHLAQDLLQAALAKTAAHWPRVRDGNPDAYVRRVLYHEHVSGWRRRRVRETLAAAPPQRLGPDPTPDTTLRLTVLRALARLPARQRAVIVLRFYEDLTEAQIADVLEVTVGTVKRTKHDALNRLRADAPEMLTDAPEFAGRPGPVPRGLAK
ncbi:SigE family RNA polymerase sigma factor [Plantactinospora soyae]|uniref:RNA polymerase sigma-70 factor (Sigma-E family) n=1 Tax=Plantactinospora soyae TaxID=1544732 RepID=A0A927MJI6_9ACTN|nr:SigE family RNA polymerase sigma factor [Plantactinospora soyae]MBE1492728.1 RNA polymerase sigma-70 factor (sigma-E family) [Plantactinospora soyae]